MKIGSTGILNIKIGNTSINRVIKDGVIYWEVTTTTISPTTTTAPTTTSDSSWTGSSPTQLIGEVFCTYAIYCHWTPGSTNVDGYILEWSTDGINFSTYEIRGGILGSAIRYTPYLLDEGTLYYIRVKAYKGSVFSLPTNVVSGYTFPTCPNSLIATSISSSQIDLTWTVCSTNQQGTAIERSTDGITNWTEIIRVTGLTNTYSDTELSSPYCYYRVRAYTPTSYSWYTSITTNISVVAITHHSYISSTGNDSTGDGSVGNPWASLYKACLEVTTKGSLIHIAAGDYIETQQINLAEGVSLIGAGDTSHIICHYTDLTTPIDACLKVVSSYPGYDGNQTISYIKFDGGLIAKLGIIVSYRNNVRVHHCNIIDFLACGIGFRNAFAYSDEKITATGLEFDNNIIKNCSGIGYTTVSGRSIFGGLSVWGTVGMLVYDNIFDYSLRTPYGIADNMVGSLNKGFKFYNNKSYRPDTNYQEWNFHLEFWDMRGGIEFYNNEFYGAGQAIDIAGINCPKENYPYSWWIHHNKMIISNIYPAAGETVSIAVNIECKCDTIIVEKNYFKNYQRASSIGVLGPGRHIKNVRFSYNIYDDGGLLDWGWGCFLQLSTYLFDSTEKIENIDIDNNIFIGGWTSGAVIVHAGYGAIKNINIRNNIIMDGLYDAGPISFGVNKVLENINVLNNIIFNNVFHDPLRGNHNFTLDIPDNTVHGSSNVTNYLESGSQEIDPLFIDKIISNFHLRFNSPLRDAGVDVDLTEDYDDNPISGLPDIGSFEYNGPDGLPSSLIVTPISGTEVDVNWTIGSTDHDGHIIKRSENAGLTYVEAGTVLGSTAIFHDTGLTPSRPYWYRITAYKGIYYSGYTTMVFTFTTPPIPYGLLLTLISGGVRVSWWDSSLGVQETEVWAYSDSGTSILLYTAAPGVTLYDDILVPVDMRYYKIRLKNGEVYSDFSDELSIAMLGTEIIESTWADNPNTWWNNNSWIPNGVALTNNGTHYCSAVKYSLLTIGDSYRVKITVIGTGYLRVDQNNPNTIQAPVTDNVSFFVAGISSLYLEALPPSFLNGAITALSLKKVLHS